MAARPVDVLIRLQQITYSLEQGTSHSMVVTEMKELFTTDAIAIIGCSSHVQRVLTLLKNPTCGLDDILEEINIVEEFLQSDEYGFREHQNGWYYF